ncbi:MAG TPA: MerR family transcriptional regulator [Gemmatimonadales bacterium]|nr:MerR family transcriptional regulator [Gemmatimonadales bacterium]
MIQPERTYEINEVARLTGLTPARLRAWERRYQVIRPHRMPNGYRAYTGDQVTLLRAFARLTTAGDRIGELALRPRDEVLARAGGREPDGSAHGALLDAVAALDRERLEALIAQQLSLRGLRAFAEEVVPPLACAVGDRWAAGTLPVSAEHLASEVVIHALKAGLRAGRADGPLALAAGLPGERHEWGFLSALTLVQAEGWRVQYLGPDLPLDDMVEAAWKLRPAAVALSGSTSGIVEASLEALVALPPRLPPGTAAVAGGAGVDAHSALLRTYGYRIGPPAFSASFRARDRAAAAAREPASG